MLFGSLINFYTIPPRKYPLYPPQSDKFFLTDFGRGQKKNTKCKSKEIHLIYSCHALIWFCISRRFRDTIWKVKRNTSCDLTAVRFQLIPQRNRQKIIYPIKTWPNSLTALLHIFKQHRWHLKIMDIALKSKTGNRASLLACKAAIRRVRRVQWEKSCSDKSTTLRKTVWKASHKLR